MLQRLRHPHIVSYQDSFVNKLTNLLCLVMTFCPGGDLHAVVQDHRKRNKRINEAQVVQWLYELTLALQYVHERHIIHRCALSPARPPRALGATTSAAFVPRSDLKTQNIFLMENKSLKLGDFGVSRVLDSPTDLARTCVGTPYYMCAPSSCASNATQTKRTCGRSGASCTR